LLSHPFRKTHPPSSWKDPHPDHLSASFELTHRIVASRFNTIATLQSITLRSLRRIGSDLCLYKITTLGASWRVVGPLPTRLQLHVARASRETLWSSTPAFNTWLMSKFNASPDFERCKQFFQVLFPKTALRPMHIVFVFIGRSSPFHQLLFFPLHYKFTDSPYSFPLYYSASKNPISAVDLECPNGRGYQG
jgi:hypothetical protein